MSRKDNINARNRRGNTGKSVFDKAKSYILGFNGGMQKGSASAGTLGTRPEGKGSHQKYAPTKRFMRYPVRSRKIQYNVGDILV